MINQVQQFYGQLTRMPFAGQPSKAITQMLPLSTDNDFAVFAEFTSTDTPVYLNIAEHYQMLSRLVATATSAWPDVAIVVRLSMPGGMRIPANLLADAVLLLEDVSDEIPKLRAQVSTLLVIDDRFARIKVDNNDNRIRLTLYSDNPAAGDPAHWSELLTLLNGWGIMPVADLAGA